MCYRLFLNFSTYPRSIQCACRKVIDAAELNWKLFSWQWSLRFFGFILCFSVGVKRDPSILHSMQMSQISGSTPSLRLSVATTKSHIIQEQVTIAPGKANFKKLISIHSSYFKHLIGCKLRKKHLRKSSESVTGVVGQPRSTDQHNCPAILFKTN